jgi:hypothetical protein
MKDSHKDLVRPSTCIDPLMMHAWLVEAKSYPVGSRERNRCLTRMLRAIAPALWRANTPYYGDALQQTWVYFVTHVCTTYDESRGSLITWLNSYLWYRHRDLSHGSKVPWPPILSLDASKEEGSTGSFIDDLPSRTYGSLSLLDQVQAWVEVDSNGSLRSTRLCTHPEVTAQVLICLRLPPETPWKAISTEFGISISSLSTFYRRKCLPLLRQFWDENDIDPGA